MEEVSRSRAIDRLLREEEQREAREVKVSPPALDVRVHMTDFALVDAVAGCGLSAVDNCLPLADAFSRVGPGSSGKSTILVSHATS
jgi:hypothetical protein